MEKARGQIADLIGADPKEVVFTSGATESNNIAVKGVGRFYGAKKKHIITTQTVISPILSKKIIFFFQFRSINVFWIHAELWKLKVFK